MNMVPWDSVVWSQNDDQMRAYITNRAAEGARRTRLENEAKMEADEIAAMEERNRAAAIAERQRIKDEALAAERAPFIPSRLLCRYIVSDILAHRKVGVREIDSNQRTQRISWCRQEIAYWLRVHTQLNLYDIASRIGVTDHSTVLYGIKTYAKRHGLEVPK